jgi:hypothetical protein
VPRSPGNGSLSSAKLARQDEFYTRLEDIESELRHYEACFRGAVVYCNCDDPRVSNFCRWFSRESGKLGLEKILTSCSDFRSPESIALLRQADIVVTNPPFSLFREYVTQLMEHGKKFIILGNQNAISYKDIFPLIRDGRLWLGVNSGDMEFKVPDYYESRTTRFWIDDDGQKWRSLGNACWFTNLDFARRHENLTLYRTYDPGTYPTYDNYNAIEVPKIADIPCDYEGAIGVPITFLAKHNPDQFDVLGIASATDPDNSLRTRIYTSQECHAAYARRFGKPGTYDLNASGVINNVKVYKRILIKRKAAS